MNSRRKEEGRSILTLPGTVRGYRVGEEKGILMTDLSKKGLYKVYDIKELLDFEYRRLDRDTWKNIRAQIERDVQIAEEENIKLGGGPFPLDPWFVVLNGRNAKVYIGDIGGYTSVSASKEAVARSTKDLKEELERVDVELEAHWQDEDE